MPIDQQAGFITAPFGDWTRPGAAAPYFRREFQAPSAPVRAVLQVSAIGLVEPHLNGSPVGDEVLAPGWTSYRHRLAVSHYDVTGRIATGPNVIGAILGEGWAVGRLGFEGRRNHYSDRPALFLRLELDYGDHTEIIGSDQEFQVSTGAVLSNDLYDGESHDARLEPRGWDQPGFDAAKWSPAEPFEWNLDALIDTGAPPIRRIEEIDPVDVATSPSGKTILDFGQNISGRVRFTVTGKAGQTVQLRHAEVCTGGEIDTETLRTAVATDRYVLRGGGTETWEPRFTFHGFRYVELGGDVEPDKLRAVVLHSDMPRTGWLETSDDRLNRLHANAVWSMRDNFVGVPTDCPQRDERLGWTGDLNAFAPAASFLHDVRGVLDSWLADLAAEQREKGYVPWVVPDVLSTPSPPTALWSDVAVSLPWALYREYGDAEILRRSYPSMTTFIRDVADRLDDNDLWSTGFQFGDWLDPDAPMDNPAGGKTDRHLVAQAFLCKTTREMALAAEVLGEDTTEFAQLADRVRTAFRREYVTPSGRISGETATAYALAIRFGILDDDQRTTAGDRLAELVAKDGYRIATGFAGTPHVTAALSETGHLEEAYLLLTETGCPSFLYPVTMGATTIWERWDSIRPDGTINPSGMTSLNHYALGAVVDWMHRVIGGLEADEPGYRSMIIAPQPGGGLTRAKVDHDTPHGRASVAWRITDQRMRVEVSIPAGTTATVVLPLDPEARVERVAGGEHLWEYALPEDVSAERHTMDTPLQTLAKDPAVWRDLTAVFAEHLPGIPIDGTAPEAAGISLNGLLQHIPGASPDFESDLRDALGHQKGRS
ncbi:glycoside hydrolase family 78 protein [Saccharopolyspora gregorii]|uniref:glycoside hydrolase family 78 protein n=1 Tax=Saccharopolyspora gregorii TaxID=33914 RepID=UPI0021AC31BD|nr:glycoside hydrolase family 78 protein [Saccharopolyspora gregorii]